MTDTVGPKEKAILTQTIAPFLRSLIGQVTSVELRNGNQVEGLLVATDCFMNLTMENVTMANASGILGKFPFFFVQNKFIMMVNIPPQLNVTQELQLQVDIATGAKRRREIKAAKEKRAQFLRMKEKRRMAGMDN